MLFRAFMWIVQPALVGIVAAMADYRDDLKAWLRSLARARGVSLTELAREAGAAVTTVTRFVNSDKWGHTLSNATIAKIEGRWDSQAPRPPGLSDAASSEFEARQDSVAARAPAHEIVMVTDDALNMRGFIRGDLCMIDPQATPKRGDIVLAEIRTPNRQGQRVLLSYDAPYLRGHSTDWELGRPVLLDADRVRIRGVVIKSTRASGKVA